MVITVISQLEGSCVVFLWVLFSLPQFKNMRVRWIENSNLSIGVNGGVDEFVCLSVSRLVTCSECTLPHDHWAISGYREWMDGWKKTWLKGSLDVLDVLPVFQLLRWIGVATGGGRATTRGSGSYTPHSMLESQDEFLGIGALIS